MEGWKEGNPASIRILASASSSPDGQGSLTQHNPNNILLCQRLAASSNGPNLDAYPAIGSANLPSEDNA